jgi:hypothetical protein
MEFLLPFEPRPLPDKISYRHSLICIGSCFAEEIGQKLKDHLYTVNLNPSGILFNSHSICNTLEMAMDRKDYQEDELVCDQGRWHSMHHHGRFSGQDQKNIIRILNEKNKELYDDIQNGSWLIITLGSSWAYRYHKTGEIVANCHKIPAREFEKVFLKSEIQEERLRKVFEKLRALNSKLKIILTVSPVRYIRDGLIENNYSKSQLITTVQELAGEFSSCYYFPAYELVNDVLRDYRFFKQDMVHPNDQAVEFVWEYFRQTCLDALENDVFNAASSLNKLRKHRPLTSDKMDQHQKQIESALISFNKELKKIIS